MSLKNYIEMALKQEPSSRPMFGPRLSGLTIGDLILRTIDETFVGPRQ